MMSDQDNALMFVEMIADSEPGSVSEHVLRGALVRCINLLKAARSENEDTQRSSPPVLPGELVEAVREYLRWLDEGRVHGLHEIDPVERYRRRKAEYEDLRKRLDAALAPLPDPLPTVESVRADERERLAKLALLSEGHHP
jgi:hypothetical protein